MTKSELVVELANQANISLKDAERITRIMFDTITQSIASGEKITISGFGTFERRRRKATMARNPKTGQPMPISEQHVASFRAGTGLKLAVKGAS